VGSGAAVATKSIAYLWHPSTVTRRVEIRRIAVGYVPGFLAGTLLVKGARITAVSGTPGGPTITPSATDAGDAAATVTFQSGATTGPTRLGTSEIFAVPIVVTQGGFWQWAAGEIGNPIVLPANLAQGFEVRAELQTALVTEMKLVVTFEWLEI
jgi:hypothetical protein